MLTWFTGLGIWIRVGIAAAIVGAFALMIWFVYHSIYESGYRDAEAKYKPQVQKLESDLKVSQADLDTAAQVNRTFSVENQRLAKLSRDQSMKLDELEAAKITAQNSARDALARVAANQKRYSAEIARLTAIVNGPPMTEGDSEEADAILRSILRDRMSVRTGAAEAGRDPAAAASGSGEGGGAAAVYQQGRFAGHTAAYLLGLEESQQGPGGSGSGDRLASAR